MIEVYRIRRKLDGRWYGKPVRFSRPDSLWKRDAGRYLTRPALLAILRSDRSLSSVAEVVTYRLEEVATSAVESFL